MGQSFIILFTSRCEDACSYLTSSISLKLENVGFGPTLGQPVHRCTRRTFFNVTWPFLLLSFPLFQCHSDVPRRPIPSYFSLLFPRLLPFLRSSDPLLFSWLATFSLGSGLGATCLLSGPVDHSPTAAAGGLTATSLVVAHASIHAAKGRTISGPCLSSRPLVAVPSRSAPSTPRSPSEPSFSPVHLAALRPPHRRAAEADVSSSGLRARSSALFLQRRRFKRSRLVFTRPVGLLGCSRRRCIAHLRPVRLSRSFACCFRSRVSIRRSSLHLSLSARARGPSALRCRDSAALVPVAPLEGLPAPPLAISPPLLLQPPPPATVVPAHGPSPILALGTFCQGPPPRGQPPPQGLPFSSSQLVSSSVTSRCDSLATPSRCTRQPPPGATR